MDLRFAQRAKAQLLSVPWQEIKGELAHAVDEVKRGFWSRHRRTAAATTVRDSQPAALEVGLSLAPLRLDQNL